MVRSKSFPALVAWILGVALMLPVTLATPADAVPLEVGYRDQSYSSSVTAPTGQKPQSKLWYADGRWWGVLWSTKAKKFTVHRFNLATQATNAWTDTGVVVDPRRNSQSDVLWDNANQKLYVISHLKDTDAKTPDQGLKFERFGYSGGSYTLEVSQTVVDRRVEAAVMDKDSTGKLWVTYTEPNSTGGRVVKVAHTTTSDTDWTAPFTLPVSETAVNTSADDISTLVAYGVGAERRVGVLWSNENTPALYFASHLDGADDADWSLTELCRTARCPDDHLNIKSIDGDASGHLYAAVKTSLNDKSPADPADPLIVVYKLDPAGTWSSSVAWTVGEGEVTRAVVALDSQNRRVHAFAAGPCCSGGTIYTKSAAFDDLSFERGNGTVFMHSATSGEAINNPTTTKQTVNGTTGLLVLAGIDDTREYVHNYLPLESPAPDTEPPTVTAVSPPDAAAEVAVSTDVSATFSEPLDGSTVNGSTVTLGDAAGTPVAAAVGYDAAANQVTLDPSADLAAGTVYTATVKGGAAGVTDAAGNALAQDQVWSFTTAAGAPGGGPETVTLTAAADSYVSSGSPRSNFGTAPALWIDGDPLQAAYLKFDLSAVAGRTVQAAELRVHTGDNASTGQQAVRLVADDSWTETGLTYANKPPVAPASLGSLGPTTTNTDYSIELPAADLAGEVGGWLSLAVDSTSTDAVKLGSRESTTPPQLVLTVQ